MQDLTNIKNVEKNSLHNNSKTVGNNDFTLYLLIAIVFIWKKHYKKELKVTGNMAKCLNKAAIQGYWNMYVLFIIFHSCNRLPMTRIPSVLRLLKQEISSFHSFFIFIKCNHGTKKLDLASNSLSFKANNIFVTFLWVCIFMKRRSDKKTCILSMILTWI